MKATVLLHRELVLCRGKYVVILKVFEVGKCAKFPRGIKAKFVMLDTYGGFARLLVDNHADEGFHVHTQLPENHAHRENLNTLDHEVAMSFFMAEVERIIENEED